ncbi:MAG: outer membrane protein assembly factor BamC [Chromatiaceae bacterium]|jgi:outer membrane protein assembly factor BamC|nr:outer membrane protein assembly factor BamC [Chromatiaceae bacterium]
MQNAIVPAILVTSILLLPACGSTPNLDDYLPDQRLQYKKQREASDNLEIPPDLTAGSFDDAMDVPPLGGTTTYSEYVGERSKRQRIAGSNEVLPEVKNVKLRREGNNRWLEIDASPQEVWPKVVGFWRSQGILLVEEDPTTGIMKTDWLENRAEIRQDFVTNMLRKVAEGLYATSLRDQYRVRIEPGLDAGTTDLYLTHRAMEERFRSNAAGEDSSTVWEPAPADPAKEAAMLRRLLVYLGVPEQQAGGLAAQQQQAADRTKSQLTTGPGGESTLIISDEYRRAWRLTGVALDRIGFAVEDRDRTQGIYYVRYDDPSKGEKKKGWGSKLAFWRDDDEKSVAQYQVKLSGDGTQTRVVVRDQVGRPASSATAERILRLLNEQIR